MRPLISCCDRWTDTRGFIPGRTTSCMSRADLGRLIEDERANAVLAWMLVGIVVLVAVGSVVRGDLLWAIFAAAVAVVAVLPPLAFGSSRARVPWEVLVDA